jgi:hypothetical protein
MELVPLFSYLRIEHHFIVFLPSETLIALKEISIACSQTCDLVKIALQKHCAIYFLFPSFRHQLEEGIKQYLLWHCHTINTHLSRKPTTMSAGTARVFFERMLVCVVLVGVFAPSILLLTFPSARFEQDARRLNKSVISIQKDLATIEVSQTIKRTFPTFSTSLK